ncbi:MULTISPECIES: DUF1127 domain-containing protein [Roseovarius]|jgi:uncharacterized protein YjiS (DUF1127 family)|uniref:YjiS-like domain-containing protein n=1 Tax=Roseovarius nubinhibens TaxID=314263 RepID=A0A348WI22_9RHOB|nr:DUF1127 domain-containing protein [Roseovarius nubinhibens]MBU2999358.1 DUF1127 domain-containing protein [Roseovarius nubinhibens]HAR54184.1 hypothetical protein [Roseovarius nubinhibens]|tara:strand:- start:1565 stop:1789 length:225 start_codon:yes stop_codon:yes gene_type:complete
MVFASDILNGRSYATKRAEDGFFAALVRKVQLRREYNKTRNELASLSDRSLADLGISRGEITAISRKAVYGYQS